MLIESIPVGMMGVNCYVFGDKKEACIIDPGGNAEKIYSYIEEHALNVKYIILTHCHFDHILATEDIKKKTNAKLVACLAESNNLQDFSINLTNRFARTPSSLVADIYVSDGDKLFLGSNVFQIIETPGHTSGGMCLYCKDQKILFSGDTLFAESIGRSDFPTGDHCSLLHSIRSKLFILPDETKVYPGHGDVTSIGYEKENNPYLQ